MNTRFIETTLLFSVILLLNVSTGCAQPQKQIIHKVDTEGFNYFPSVSPNGKYISYVKMVEEDYDLYGAIWLYDVVKDTSHRIIKGANHAKSLDNYPSWSPNSDAIYFSSVGNLFKYNIESGDVEVLFKTDIEKENRTAFAPMISPDGNKLAFWTIDYGSNTHTVSYLNLDSHNVTQLEAKKFNPGTEVTFYNPQWSKDSQKVLATYFHPASQIKLFATDLATKETVQIDQNLRSTYFKVQNNKAYYVKYDTTRLDPQKGYAVTLVQANLNGGDPNQLLVEDPKAVFDVSASGTIYYGKSDKDMLYYQNEKKHGSLISGSNPSVGVKKLVFERWFDIDTGPGFENHLFWMNVMERDFK